MKSLTLWSPRIRQNGWKRSRGVKKICRGQVFSPGRSTLWGVRRFVSIKYHLVSVKDRGLGPGQFNGSCRVKTLKKTHFSRKEGVYMELRIDFPRLPQGKTLAGIKAELDAILEDDVAPAKTGP